MKGNNMLECVDRVTENLSGEALKAQRFGILTDIANDLNDGVLFPIHFDVTVAIRDAAVGKASPERLAELCILDPLVYGKLLRLAAARDKKSKRTFLEREEVFSILDIDGIRKVVSDISTRQLLASRTLAGFSDWIAAHWARTRQMAISAKVMAAKYTEVSPQLAAFTATCRELPFFYMLHRAVQYDELLARPESLRHLVINWYDGIANTLWASLKLPAEIIEALQGDEEVALVKKPRSLREVVSAGRILQNAPAELESWLAPREIDNLLVECRNALQKQNALLLHSQ